MADGGRRLDPSKGAVRTTAEFELLIPFDEAVDRGAEIEKIRREIARLEKDIQAKTARLADEAFRSKAPPDVVRTMEQALGDRRAEFERLRTRLSQHES